MDFFKSVFADEDNNHPQSPQPEPEPESKPEDQPTKPKWGFMGGLIKTITKNSESMIETYRKDLQEFSTGLKKETQVLKEVASSSLEVGASKAQVSLESVGQAFDSFGSVVWSSTAQIINQGSNFNDKDGTFDVDFDVGPTNNSPLGKYSRFEEKLRGIQNDMGTFLEEPEDLDEYKKWKLGFDLGEKREEIEGLIRENGNLEGVFKRVVPNLVDYDLFWCRYFFRVFKLEQAESVRAKLVERANEDEDLSWDVDDDDDDDDDDDHENEGNNGNLEKEKEKDNVVVKNEGETSLIEEVKKVVVVEEKAVSEASKDSDISVVSSQPSSRGEEDLGWDEIEDLGSDDEDGGKKGKGSESLSNREELRKRLSSVKVDDEDLSWDIEDDDEPIKKS